jgi:integrase
MNAMIVAPRTTDWHRLKSLVLDSVSSPITKRVYNLGLDEFFEWFGREPRPGFTKATVRAWRVALEARGLGSVSINVRITAVRKLAVEAADNGLLAPELAAGITRVKGAKSKSVRVGNWLSLRQAQALLNAPDTTTKKGLRDRAMLAILLGCGLRRSEVAALTLAHSTGVSACWYRTRSPAPVPRHVRGGPVAAGRTDRSGFGAAGSLGSEDYGATLSGFCGGPAEADCRGGTSGLGKREWSLRSEAAYGPL